RRPMPAPATWDAMLSGAVMQCRCAQGSDDLIRRASKEVERTRWEPPFNRLARMYLERFTRAREVFVNQYSNNLLYGFRRFFEAGKLELITCGATHGFLPLMVVNDNARRAQIEVGGGEFEGRWGKGRKGIWLPECGYAEGIDKLLGDSGLRYFFTDTHGVLFAEPRPRYGVYAPILCPDSRVAALGRDTESSKQV